MPARGDTVDAARCTACLGGADQRGAATVAQIIELRQAILPERRRLARRASGVRTSGVTRRLEPWRDWAIIAAVNNGMLLAIAMAHPGPGWLLLAGLPLGFGLAVGTLTVLHDAGHRMYGTAAWPNVLACQTSTPVGLWVGHWGLKHRSHHKVSQIYPLDESTRSSDMVRLHPAAPSLRRQRTQHVHAWALYCLAWAGELRSQLTYLRTGVVTGAGSTPSGRQRAVSFGTEKLLCLALLTPYAVILGPGHLALLLVVAMSVASLLAAVALTVGHINVGLEPQADDDERWDWATNLFRSTASFAVDSVVMRWLTGGLTLHLAHHLRPMAVRSELPEVHATVVADFAERTQLPSIEFPTMRAAVAGHYRRLRELAGPTAR
jgi:fatty acid desaturase